MTMAICESLLAAGCAVPLCCAVPSGSCMCWVLFCSTRACFVKAPWLMCFPVILLCFKVGFVIKLCLLQVAHVCTPNVGSCVVVCIFGECINMMLMGSSCTAATSRWWHYMLMVLCVCSVCSVCSIVQQLPGVVLNISTTTTSSSGATTQSAVVRSSCSYYCR
jgi:hypothetical protein